MCCWLTACVLSNEMMMNWWWWSVLNLSRWKEQRTVQLRAVKYRVWKLLYFLGCLCHRRSQFCYHWTGTRLYLVLFKVFKASEVNIISLLFNVFCFECSRYIFSFITFLSSCFWCTKALSTYKLICVTQIIMSTVSSVLWSCCLGKGRTLSLEKSCSSNLQKLLLSMANLEQTRLCHGLSLC